jgi:hypothetical protein
MRLLGFWFSFMLYIWSATRPPLSTRAPASTPLIKGYNIAWWDVNYGHQWNAGSFSEKKVREMLDLASQGQAKIVRVWLFEDSHQWQFELDEAGTPIRLRKEFIPNVLYFLKECEKRGLKANLTLFDGNAFPIERLPSSEKRAWWWNVLNDKHEHGDWFHKEITTPLFDAIADEDLTGTIAQVELMNEIDGAVKSGIFARDWTTVRSFVCTWQKRLKPAGISYGVSVGPQGSVNHIVDDDIPSQCTDYLDLHVYNDNGSIPMCRWFQKKAAEGRRFQLGEFGQKSSAFDDEAQKKLTANFLSSAAECGFESALAWRLEDLRPGHNKEARHSYTAFGDPRPAWYVLRNYPGQFP